jgi:hypothetical protein
VNVLPLGAVSIARFRISLVPQSRTSRRAFFTGPSSIGSPEMSKEIRLATGYLVQV